MELTDAERMARYHMQVHGLHGWAFRFDKATRRFGCCDFTHRTISLSRRIVLLNEPDRVRLTVLHEVAHALAGPGAGHGKMWREIVLRLGGDPQRCYGAEVALPDRPAKNPRRAAAPAARAVFVVSARGVVTVPRMRTRRNQPATQR